MESDLKDTHEWHTLIAAWHPHGMHSVRLKKGTKDTLKIDISGLSVVSVKKGVPVCKIHTKDGTDGTDGTHHIKIWQQQMHESKMAIL